jgi:hypothetical protein
MTYFRNLLDVEYQSPLPERTNSGEYIVAKNIFRRMKIRDDLQNVFTIFNKYQIENGKRPDLVAEEVYGSADFDWVVLISAGIINVRDEWPLSEISLYNYAEKKYGDTLTSPHHYETVEIKDSRGRLILPAGKVVDQNFSITYYDGTYVTKNPATSLVTNYEYEVQKNNEKESIYILKAEYLNQVILDMKDEMIYGKSSSYVNDRLITTENTRVTMI